MAVTMGAYQAAHNLPIVCSRRWVAFSLCVSISTLTQHIHKRRLSLRISGCIPYTQSRLTFGESRTVHGIWYQPPAPTQQR